MSVKVKRLRRHPPVCCDHLLAGLVLLGQASQSNCSLLGADLCKYGRVMNFVWLQMWTVC